MTERPWSAAGVWLREKPRFGLDDLVKKRSGSSWRGKVSGFYSTRRTPVGYVVESLFEPDSVQNYPEEALEPWDGPDGQPDSRQT